MGGEELDIGHLQKDEVGGDGSVCGIGDGGEHFGG